MHPNKQKEISSEKWLLYLQFHTNNAMMKKKGGHKMEKTEIGNGFYEIAPDTNYQHFIKSKQIASKKMVVYETDTGGFYIIKMVDENKNIRKLYYPLSYGLSMWTYNGKIPVTSEKIIFKENGEVQISHTNNTNPNLTKDIFYRKDGSIYKRTATLKINSSQKSFHLEENGIVYDEKGNIVLKTMPNRFEKQSYIDALTARAKLNHAETKKEEITNKSNHL